MTPEQYEQEFQQMRQEVSDVRRAVIGDEKFGEDGLVKRVKKLEDWRAWLMLKLAMVIGVVATIGWLARLAFGH